MNFRPFGIIMEMRAVLPVVLLVLGQANAQVKEKASNKLLKLNFNYVQWLDKREIFEIGNVAPAIVLNADRKHLHEIELNSFKIRKTEKPDVRTGSVVGGVYRNEANVLVGGARDHHASIGIRYQYAYCLGSHPKWKPYVGISLLQRYYRNKHQPYLQEAFNYLPVNGMSWKVTVYDIMGSIVAGSQYRWGKRMAVEVSVPVDFCQWGVYFQRTYNPSFPPRAQRIWYGDGEFRFFNNLHLRAGLGISI